jgi:hypothetical protein
MGTRVFEFPLNGGQNEGADRTLLEPGELRALFDGRLTRDGRIEVRPVYTQLSNHTLPSDLGVDIFDLTSYHDQLVALGAFDTGFSDRHPYYPFVYTASGWAAQANVNYHLISPVTELEILYQAPYGNVMSNSDIAYTNGALCFCSVDATSNAGSIYVLDCASNTVVAFKRATSLDSIRCIAIGNKFVIITRDTAGSMTGYTFDTTAYSSGFSVGNTFITTILGDSFGWDLAPVGGGTTDWLISFSNTSDSTMRLRRYTIAFAATSVTSVAARNGNSCVISDGTKVVWCFTNGNNIEMRTYGINVSAGVVVGPTTVMGPAGSVVTANIVGTPSVHFESLNATQYVTVHGTTSGSLGIDDTNWGIFEYVAAHTLINNARGGNIRIASKTQAMALDSRFNVGIGLGTMIVGGNTSGTDQVYATCISLIEETQHTAARWNYGFADKLDAPSSSSNKHGRSSIATDGSGTYWACAGAVDESAVGTAGRGTLQVVKFKAGSNARRQCAEMQGALYIAGGFTYYYDRGMVAAESGFLDTPVIKSLTQATGGAGALTLLATYTYVAVYEWQDTQGRIHRSTPSTPKSVTLTGANNEVLPQVSTPRSLRRSSLIGDANSCKIVIYRSNPSDSVFFRVCETTAAGSATYADVANADDILSDAASQVRPVLYTQSQKPTANVAMQPCRFIAAGKDRMIFGGLPDPYLVQLSQLAFPGEPIENASPNNFSFQARLPEPCTGVACPGDSYIAFTASGIYEIPGEGPQRNGNGEFFTPRAIFTDGGCIDWRSICETGKGTFFQLDTDKIFMLGLDGSCTWVGQPVRDTLVTYPVIVGSCLCSATQRVAFACTNSAADDGVILIYDLRRGIWSVDRVGATRTVCEYLGRLAYVATTGRAFLENAAIGAGGTMPTLSPRTGDFKLFGGMGNGNIAKIGLLGTYLGDSTVEAFISLDDGKTWTSLGSFAVTSAATDLGNPVSGSALASGDPVTLLWKPNTCSVDRFALRFDMSNGTDTGGMRMHMVSLEVEADEFTTRKGAGSQR